MSFEALLNNVVGGLIVCVLWDGFDAIKRKVLR